MKLIILIVSFFSKGNSWSPFFSNAVSEGIKDMFKEMGYTLPDNSGNEINDTNVPGHPRI